MADRLTIALAQLNPVVGDVRGNADLLLGARDEAARDGADPGQSPESLHHTHAERRRLTVMFVDLIGSTALSSRLDPEEWSEVSRE